MNRRFIKLVILFGLIHYATVLSVAGLIFVISHIPPRAVILDVVILALFKIEWVLIAPRKFLLWLWPGELTPVWLGFATTLSNSLLWGTVLAALKMFWHGAAEPQTK